MWRYRVVALDASRHMGSGTRGTRTARRTDDDGRAALAPRAVRYTAGDDWVLVRDGALLIFSAGADEAYAIDDLASETAAEVEELWADRSVSADDLSPDALATVLSLAAAGIVKRIPAEKRAPIDVAVEGAPAALVAALRRSADPAAVRFVDPDAGSDLAVVVRTTGRLTEILDAGYRNRLLPHLLLDLAYAHTVSLGPLVFRGETACLGCLTGRIAQLWGDPEPPARPAVQQQTELIAALLLAELERYARGDYSLANATVAWNLRERSVQRNAVYRLPWCPFCADEAPEPLASLPLPWLER